MELQYFQAFCELLLLGKVSVYGFAGDGVLKVVAHVVLAQLGQGVLRDYHFFGALGAGHAVYRGVVTVDQVAVAGHPKVGLADLDPVLVDRCAEGHQRIFGVADAPASVGGYHGFCAFFLEEGVAVRDLARRQYVDDRYKHRQHGDDAKQYLKPSAFFLRSSHGRLLCFLREKLRGLLCEALAVDLEIIFVIFEAAEGFLVGVDAHGPYVDDGPP